MTDAATQKSGSRPWTLTLNQTTPFNEGTGSNDAPYLNFRADIETSRGIKNRFVSVFNTQRFPTLIEDVRAAFASGTARVTLRFEYDQGETVKILGVGHVSFRKAANDVDTSSRTTDTVETPAQETTAETPSTGTTVAGDAVDDGTPTSAEAPEPTTVSEPAVATEAPVEGAAVVTEDPMQGVVVETRTKRKRRLKAA